MKNKKICSVVALVLLASASVASSQQPVEMEGGVQRTNTSLSKVLATSLTGKVADKGTSLTVLTPGVRPLDINVGVNAQTTFYLNGVVTKFADILIGDWVVVKYLPIPGQAVNAISVEAHRHRLGTVSFVLDPLPPPADYPYCPYVGHGGTVTGTPCYCAGCGGAGSGMVW